MGNSFNNDNLFFLKIVMRLVPWIQKVIIKKLRWVVRQMKLLKRFLNLICKDIKKD